MPDVDGSRETITGQYDIRFVLPIWSLISHYVNVYLETGAGKATVMLVKNRNITDNMFRVGIPGLDHLLAAVQYIYRVIVAIAGPKYHEGPCPYKSPSDQVAFYYDWSFNQQYDYNYLINGA